jgi:protein-disulfide isomerase
MHPDAYWKSKTIVNKNSLQLLEDSYESKPIPKPEMETDEIDNNIRLGTELGISGTPTLIMPDGLMVGGLIDADTIIELVFNSSKK